MELQQKLQEVIRVVENFPREGISFKDITPVLLDPDLVMECIMAMSLPWKNKGITKVIGIESRGFLFGPPIALELNAGFVIVRKQGKLPPATEAVSYTLEYGSAIIEISKNAIQEGDRVLIHDDLLATGGTAAAAAKLVKNLGGIIVGFSFLSSLEFLKGHLQLEPFSSDVHKIINF